MRLRGALRWKHAAVRPAPMSLSADRDCLFWLEPDAVVAADVRNGRGTLAGPAHVGRPSSRLFVAHARRAKRRGALRRAQGDRFGSRHGDRKTCAGLSADIFPGELVAYEARSGKRLWSAPCAENFHAAIDVFVNGQQVWRGQSRGRVGPDYTQALDLPPEKSVSGSPPTRPSTPP